MNTALVGVFPAPIRPLLILQARQRFPTITAKRGVHARSHLSHSDHHYCSFVQGRGVAASSPFKPFPQRFSRANAGKEASEERRKRLIMASREHVRGTSAAILNLQQTILIHRRLSWKRRKVDLACLCKPVKIFCFTQRKWLHAS